MAMVKATATTMVVTVAPPIRPSETVEIDLYYLCGEKETNYIECESQFQL